MRHTFESNWGKWGAVWRAFGEIRTEIGLRGLGRADNKFAFINLARCAHPPKNDDDVCIKTCPKNFPLSEVVDTIDARVIFIAKDGKTTYQVPPLAGESNGSRLVFRYSNWGAAEMKGEAKKIWLPRIAAEVRTFIGHRCDQSYGHA